MLIVIFSISIRADEFSSKFRPHLLEQEFQTGFNGIRYLDFAIHRVQFHSSRSSRVQFSILCQRRREITHDWSERKLLLSTITVISAPLISLKSIGKQTWNETVIVMSTTNGDIVFAKNEKSLEKKIDSNADRSRSISCEKHQLFLRFFFQRAKMIV